MDGQQRLLGRRPTPEPLDILAFGEEQEREKREKKKKRNAEVQFPFFSETFKSGMSH